MTKLVLLLSAIVLALTVCGMPAFAQEIDAERDILVTYDNKGTNALGTGFSTPYQSRKRYSIAANARHNSNAVRDKFSLVEIDHWPIRSLSIYCVVYRVPLGEDRDSVVQRLRSEERLESVQPLHQFETTSSHATVYDDTHAQLQYGLNMMGINTAHRYSRGRGIRVAIIDGHADTGHEDLVGRVGKIKILTATNVPVDARHGTAIASVIAANADNARGIVGIAPEATIELFVSCWADDGSEHVVCDSFTIAKALDALLNDPPHVLNLSIIGPHDPLIERLLNKAASSGVIIVAASSSDADAINRFPASLKRVIGVGNSNQHPSADKISVAKTQVLRDIFAPGDQIMVAVPNNSYDFRSGTSLAVAHVSGVIALLKSVSPNLQREAVRSLLQQSQNEILSDRTSINACIVLILEDPSRSCIEN